MKPIQQRWTIPALPPTPQIVRRERLSERAAAALDAILALAPADAGEPPLAQLPQVERWRRLRERADCAPGAVRSATLANTRDTRAILGLLPPRASPFETLALAGRMLQEVGSEAQTIALVAPAAADDALAALLSAALAHAFELPSFRTSERSRSPAAGAGARAARRPLRRIELIGAASLDLSFLEAAGRGNNLARLLTSLPPNVLDADAYRRFAAAVARDHRLGFRWLDERALGRLGANAFLAVARGNADRGAGIAHLTYRPAVRRRHAAARGADNSRRGRQRTPPGRRTPLGQRGGGPDVALVGKGILFDTGGTNLKPHRAMLDMHTDMSGSAVALATLGALAELEAPLAADAWLAITENRIGPRAFLPQEVVRAANGTTIQVIHTDAEGRMVLADTLALAARTKPRLMLDFATLTGTCVVALSERMSGVVTNEPRLTAALLEAGRASGERVWNFPFEADYDSDLESKVADVLQCSVEAKGDHILAARFLGRFVPAGQPWAHLDLSSAVRSGGLAHVPTDVTGFGVRYALELLLHTRVLDALEADD